MLSFQRFGLFRGLYVPFPCRGTGSLDTSGNKRGLLTDRVGFEPTEPLRGSHALQACAFSRSATCPKRAKATLLPCDLIPLTRHGLVRMSRLAVGKRARMAASDHCMVAAPRSPLSFSTGGSRNRHGVRTPEARRGSPRILPIRSTFACLGAPHHPPMSERPAVCAEFPSDQELLAAVGRPR